MTGNGIYKTYLLVQEVKKINKKHPRLHFNKLLKWIRPVVYRKTDEWYIEWQRMTTSGTTSDNEWQRVTTNDNEWYNEWQRMTMSENEWKRMTESGNEW